MFDCMLLGVRAKSQKSAGANSYAVPSHLVKELPKFSPFPTTAASTSVTDSNISVAVNTGGATTAHNSRSCHKESPTHDTADVLTSGV